MLPFWTPLKTEDFWFAGVFRGYKMETLAKNGLVKFDAATLLFYDKLRRL